MDQPEDWRFGKKTKLRLSAPRKKRGGKKLGKYKMQPLL